MQKREPVLPLIFSCCLIVVEDSTFRNRESPTRLVVQGFLSLRKCCYFASRSSAASILI